MIGSLSSLATRCGHQQGLFFRANITQSEGPVRDVPTTRPGTSNVWSLEEAFGAIIVITLNNAGFLVSPTLIRSSIIPWLFQFSEV